MRRDLVTKRRGAIEMECAGGFRTADLFTPMHTDSKSGSSCEKVRDGILNEGESVCSPGCRPLTRLPLSAIVNMRGALASPLHKLS
jgi:hypothetical protein